jgi:hypothetical protein
MRTDTLFSSVDAGSNQTSTVIEPECGQRMEWLLQLTSTGLDGNPLLVIEYSLDNSTWTPLFNPYEALYTFLLDEFPYAVKDDRMNGKYIRIRLETNGNTTGTISALLGVKTYP